MNIIKIKMGGRWMLDLKTVILLASVRAALAQGDVPVPVWVIGVVAGVVGLLLLTLLLLGVFCCGKYSHKCMRRRNTNLPRGAETYDGFMLDKQRPIGRTSVFPTFSDIAASMATSVTTVNDQGPKELPRVNVNLSRQMGTCMYGPLWDAEVLIRPGYSSRAMIKELQSANDRELVESFFKEANHLMKLEHNNVTSLFGIVSFTLPYYMIIELPAKGDLKSFLLACQEPSNASMLTSGMLVSMICNAARGMAYLHSKSVVHRDIAARNCVVTNKLTVKLSMYGVGPVLFKAEYSKLNVEEEAIPLRWLSPEVLEGKARTSLSDVWAFGMLMWEIVTLGSFPFEEFQDEEIKSLLCAKQYRPPKPFNCTEDLYEVMLRCWKGKPTKRPSAEDIVIMLERSDFVANYLP